MSQRRSKGDGGLNWDAQRQRWIATVYVGYDARGKRIARRRSGRTKTDAKAKLKELLRDYEDGLAIAPSDYTVENAVNDWLAYGRTDVDEGTVGKDRILCETHVMPALGARKLRDLSADDVDKWLAAKATTHSTETVRMIRSCLNRAVKRAMARDKVKRNVVELCAVPTGQPGRPSKAFTLAQAEAVLAAAAKSPMHAYIVVSLLTGARTEELRALTWDHVDLEGKPDAVPEIPPHIAVWRSMRSSGDTKTRKSRRTLALPARCVEALREHRRALDTQRERAGERWREHGLVFPSEVGTPRLAGNVRRSFRSVLAQVPGITPHEWTPREARTSFVSLLSDNDVPIEVIARLVGHSGTTVTERVYRKQIRPVIQNGAVAMDKIFKTDAKEDEGGNAAP